MVIHLVNQFIDEVEAGASGAEAVENAVGHVGMACLLTSVTNAMGFFSLPVIQAPAIQEFGLFAGLGVLLAFVVTMTFAPAGIAAHRTGVLDALAAPQRGASRSCARSAYHLGSSASSRCISGRGGAARRDDPRHMADH